MVRRRTAALLALTAVAVALPASASAAAAAQGPPLLTQRGHTTVKAYTGSVLLSRQDADGFHLALAAGGTTTDLPFPAQAQPFDADIGPGPDSRPTVVASICGATAGSCHLELLRVGDTTPTTLELTDDPIRDELHPTISGQRVAWVRPRSTARSAVQNVYTRRLNAPARVRSTRVVAPARDVEVQELELTTNQLAYVANDLGYEDAGICGLRSARLLSLTTKRTTTFGRTICGLNGQSFAGVSFNGSTVYAAQFCGADGTCDGKVLRFDPRTRKLATAPLDNGTPLDGFAYTGSGNAWLSRDPGADCNRTNLDQAGCDVVQTTGLRFTKARLPR